MKRVYAWRDNQLVELTSEQVDDLHYVQDDVKEFRSPDGAVISGRTQWREHLKRTDCVEMGHSDMKAAQRNWNKRQDAQRERVARGEKYVREAEPPNGEIRPMERSRIGAEVANRLYNRPTPDRKTMIKIALEEAKRR